MEKYPGYSRETSNEDDDDDESVDSADDPKGHDDSQQGNKSKSDYRAKEQDRAKQELDNQEESEHNEPEPPLKELGEDEKKLVANEYVGARGEAIRDELEAAEPESAEEAELLANAALLEAINHKLNAGTPPTEAALNDAVAETAENLGIGVPEAALEAAEVQTAEVQSDDLPEQDSAISPMETTAETVNIQPPESVDTTHIVATNPVNPVTALPNINGSNPNVQPPAPNPNLPPLLPPNPNLNPNQNTNNGNYIPPAPPIPPYYNGGGGGGNYLPPYGPNISGLNYGNPAVNPNSYIPPTPNSDPSRRKNAQYFLVGGLLGYLVGRRRGRIKTEKKLLPVQHKLEKEVKDLHASIAVSEEKIRKLVREQVVAKPAMAKQIVERLSTRKQRQTTARTIETVAANSEKANETDTQTFSHETVDIPKGAAVVESASHDKPEALKIPDLAAAAESVAERTIGPIRRTEKVGRLVTLEQDNTRTLYEHELDELPPERPITLKVPERPKTIEAMTLVEVLVIAQRIPLERSNVKKLFEANRLNEKSLRLIAETYLRGERYEKIVKDNLLDKEIVSVNGVESFESKREQHNSEPVSFQNQPRSSPILPNHQQADTPQVVYSSADQDGLATSPVDKPVTSKSLIKKGLPLAIVIIVAILLLLLGLGLRR